MWRTQFAPLSLLSLPFPKPSLSITSSIQLFGTHHLQTLFSVTVYWHSRNGNPDYPCLLSPNPPQVPFSNGKSCSPPFNFGNFQTFGYFSPLLNILPFLQAGMFRLINLLNGLLDATILCFSNKISSRYLSLIRRRCMFLFLTLTCFWI